MSLKSLFFFQFIHNSQIVPSGSHYSVTTSVAKFYSKAPFSLLSFLEDYSGVFECVCHNVNIFNQCKLYFSASFGQHNKKQGFVDNNTL